MRALQPLILAATLLTGGGVIAADAAHADAYFHPTCRTTSPGIVLGAGPYGSEYTTNGILIETIYGTTPGGYGAVNCRYQGSRYRWTASSGAVSLGSTTWLEPRIYNGA